MLGLAERTCVSATQIAHDLIDGWGLGVVRHIVFRM